MTKEAEINKEILDDKEYDKVKKSFRSFWKREWDKLEGDIDEFSFKFYKEGYKEAKQEAKISEDEYMKQVFNEEQEKRFEKIKEKAKNCFRQFLTELEDEIDVLQMNYGNLDECKKIDVINLIEKRFQEFIK
jgi:hypothetical protein